MFTLINPCNYSFRDLAMEAFPSWTSGQIDRLLQFYYHKISSKKDKDVVIRQWCILAGWFYKDVMGSDGKMYRSFSPKKKNV